jgi:Spy/CpxP family protein refolding chaperone
MTRGSVVLVAALALAGTALAQSPPPAAQWHGHHEWKDAAQWRQQMEQRRMDRLTLLLDLTPAQRQQVQAVFSDEQAKMKTAMQQVRQAMEQAHAAHEAVRKDAEHRLSSVLSPIQMRKLRVLMPEHGMMMHGMMMHGMDHDMDHGMGPPPGSGGP